MPTSSAPNLPLVQAYHPTTFLERGVAVPFTTPMLAGTRARPGERSGTELIVPNPAGGRGVYILPWAGVCQLCRPTVHDTCMNDKVAALRSVTPATIRQAAREVAAQGLAGHDARAAADAAGASEYQDRLLTNFLLLLALVEQVDPVGLGRVPENRARTAELELRAKRTVIGIAPKLGRPADSIATTLEEIAGIFVGIGLPGQSSPARVPRLLEALCRLRAETAAWAREHNDESGAQASMVSNVADLTVSCAEKTLAQAYELTQDVAGLLREWGTAPQRVIQLVARPEWLLDGWEQICLIWECSDDDAARRSALVEISLLVPVLPKETSDWVGTNIDADLALRFRRTVSLNQDWRTGAVFERIARNEKLRALAA